MTTTKKGQALTIKGSRILIAGAASLVGSHTADLLLKEGAREVLLLDNFSFGSMDAIEHLQNDPRIKIVRADLMRLPDLLMATEGVDGVVHLAAYMTLGFSQTPWQAVDVNIRGAQNMLEACRVNKVKKIIFASSNAVYGYGSGIKGALSEEIPFHSVGAPPAAILYGASKIMGNSCVATITRLLAKTTLCCAIRRSTVSANITALRTRSTLWKRTISFAKVRRRFCRVMAKIQNILCMFPMLRVPT